MGFLWLAVSLGVNLPHPYPIHSGLAGTPDAWAEGPGMWVLVVVRRANRLLGLVNTCMLLTYSAVIPLAEAWGLPRMVKRKLREEGLLT